MMAERSSFFNSVAGDRRYKADDFANYFKKFLTNGVYPNVGNNLQIIADAGNMTSKVKPGAAWINGYMYENDSDLVLQHDVADGVLKRIDRIVVKLDYIGREIRMFIKKGAFASSPVAPTLQRDADAFELAIADVFIGNGVISISQSNVTDLRLNTSLCGMVNSLLQADTTGIFNQYQTWFNETSQMHEEEFQEWFDTVKGQLSGDVAANLSNQITQIDTDLTNLEQEVTTKEQTANAHYTDDVKHLNYAVASGTNTYTVTIPDIEALVEGISIKIKFTNANTGASTLNINGLGAKAIQKGNGNALSSGNIKAGQICHMVYTGSVFQLLGEGGEYGTVTANDVRSTKTFGSDNGLQQGALDLANLIPSNIKKDIAIDGITGTLVEGVSPGVYRLVSSSLEAASASLATNKRKVKEIRVFAPGIYRVYFALKESTAGQIGYGAIYKNGIQVGLTRMVTTTTYTSFTEDISASANDLIQLYLWTENTYTVFATSFALDTNVGAIVTQES